MNDQTPDFESTQNPGALELPELSEGTIARIESAVFADIAAERAPARAKAAKSSQRRRGWLTGIGIAAAFAVGVLVTPPILNTVGGSGSMTSADSRDMSGGSSSVESGAAPESSAQDSSGAELQSGDVVDAAAADASDGREIISTAQVTLQVQSIADAADAISDLADAHDGYVESTSIGKSAAVVDDGSMPAPVDGAYGMISIRIPSADLTDVIAALDDSGEVLSSSITKQDVTSTSINLQARIDATSASVDRLTELMSQSGSVSELIEAEVALTDRQAQLEAYQQELKSLTDQVAMSSVYIDLTRQVEPTTADPAGFGDGLLAGWNGLVVSLNALVIALGFVLPWLAVAGAVVLIVWLIRRTRRRPKNER